MVGQAEVGEKREERAPIPDRVARYIAPKPRPVLSIALREGLWAGCLADSHCHLDLVLRSLAMSHDVPLY